MSTCGVQQDNIALVLGIDAKTLRKHYRKELDAALAEAVSDIGKSLLNKAREGCTKSQIFFLKTRGRWSEKMELEHSGAVKTSVPDEDREILKRFLEQKDKTD